MDKEDIIGQKTPDEYGVTEDPKGEKDLALVPIREEEIQFYGDSIPVAQTPDGEIYVPLRPLTDFLGLAFGSQTNRVRRDEVLAARVRTIVMARSDGRRVGMLCLPLDLLPGWLFGLQPSRVRPELVEKLLRYRGFARVCGRESKITQRPTGPHANSPQRSVFSLASSNASLIACSLVIA